jgi:hypothetical protein
MDLVIKEEKYQIKVGSEVYTVNYPSFEEAREIPKSFEGKKSEEAIEIMKKWLLDLGLDPKFFEIKAVKAKHIMKIWEDLNTVKK